MNPNTRITAMLGRTGRAVANQFVINTPDGTYFQSYGTVIAFIPRSGGPIQLDPKWNCSKTTSKYRSAFLGETTKETEKKIKSGEYKVEFLRQPYRILV